MKCTARLDEILMKGVHIFIVRVIPEMKNMHTRKFRFYSFGRGNRRGQEEERMTEKNVHRCGDEPAGDGQRDVMKRKENTDDPLGGTLFYTGMEIINGQTKGKR